MPYCSIADIENVIPEVELINLTVDPPFPQGEELTVNTERVNQIISFADEIIDGYLRSRYSLPLSQVPELVKNISVDIAVYRLYLRRPQKLNESVENSYKNAVRLLEQIQKGFLQLGIDNPDNTETTVKTVCYRTNKTKQDRIFSKDVLSRF